MSKLKFASLTAGLLARKGEAEPSATPFAEQLLTRVGAPAVDLRPMIPNQTALKPPSVVANTPVFGRRPAHDIDHPHQEPVEMPPAPIPLHSPSLHQAVDDETHDVHHEVRCGSCTGPSPDDAHKTYHVNLRMKRMRFIRLKLTAALLRKPVQEIVSEALDAWFDTVPTDVLGDCACLHSRAD
jgi:hypothetical protein